MTTTLRTPARRAALAAATVALAAGGLWAAGPASAATCGDATHVMRYATSTNTIYLTSGTFTPSDIVKYCPSAPLSQTNAATKTWLLSADLLVEDNATLLLRGTGAAGTPAPDVNTLRLRSLPSNKDNDVADVTGQTGDITLDHVAVTSWVPSANAPDNTVTLPAGAAATDQARAFIRTLSILAPTGKRESTMNIVSSDVGYLGYHGAEAYGVSYKARGCDATPANLPNCAKLDVYGKQVNSKFHNNFFGTYTYNAKNMVFSGSQYFNNISYGLDPHDDSDYLTITNNKFYHNGNHGLICSQRCDHLTITNNESYQNGLPPYVPIGDDNPSDNQVHGIMLHRGVTASVVRGNNVHDNPNGAGIAIFDSVGNTVDANTVSRNKFGIRLSVGTRNVAITNNTVTASTQYGVFTYKGTDLPTYSGSSGRPSANTFTGNTFSGATSYIVRLQQTDGTIFTGNKVAGTVGGGINLDRAAKTTWTVGTGSLPATVPFVLVGTPTERTALTTFGVPSTQKVTKDANSTITFK